MASVATTPAGERALLAAARAGDEGAYRRLVEPLRPELHAHCYRMLGSVHDAEDALQDALLRAWRGLAGFEGRASVRSWLYRIATNACLDALARRPRRGLPIDHAPAADPAEDPGPPLAESVWIEPYPDAGLGLPDGAASPEARYEQSEGVELAFAAALQLLPPNQRAALILREVLGYSAREVAETLETSVASVNSALQRARETVEARLPERSQQATLRTLGDRRVREVVEAYTRAMQRGDVDAVVAMLARDAAWSMPPVPAWYHGHAAIAGFLRAHPLRERWRHVPTRANGQLAIGCYMWDEERGGFYAAVLDVIELRDDRIASVTGFLSHWVYRRFGDVPGGMTVEDFARFGLPETVPA